MVSMARSSGFAHRRLAKKQTSLRVISAHRRSASRSRSGPAAPLRFGSRKLKSSSHDSAPRPPCHAMTREFSHVLPPFSLEREGRPIEWRLPAVLFPHVELSLPQRGGRGTLRLEHLGVEPAHQLAGGLVVHFPEAGHHALGPGVEKAA